MLVGVGVHGTEPHLVQGGNPVPQGRAEEERNGRYTLSTSSEKNVFPFVAVPWQATS